MARAPSAIAQPNDHAIVIGISAYPGLLDQDGRPRALDGPVNDAKAIRDWLLSAKGGGLDPKNLFFLCSRGRNAIAPKRANIEAAFEKVVERTRQSGGKRLYVYVSGHGFSTDHLQASILAGDFTEDLTANCFVTEWVKCLKNCRRFEEYVLWFDGCMVQMPIAEAGVSMKRCAANNNSALAPQMLAFATMSGRVAMEYPIADDGGKVHGIFTWALLEGLRKLGAVNANALKTHILQSMADLIPHEERDKPGFEPSPTIMVLPEMAAPSSIVFGCGAPPEHPVQIKRGAAVAGQEVIVWGGSPLAEVTRARLTARGVALALPRGLYAAEVKDAGLLELFEVSGPEVVALTLKRKGKLKPLQPGAVHQLRAHTANPAATLTLLDGTVSRVAQANGVIAGEYPLGIYKIVAQFARNVGSTTGEIILIDRDITALTLSEPPLASPAAIANTRFTHEYQIHAAESLARAGSALGLLARYWTGPEPKTRGRNKYPHPFSGLSLHSRQGALIADIQSHQSAKISWGPGNGDPVATAVIPLEPETYILRQTLPDGRIRDRAVVISPAWTTEVQIQRSIEDLQANPPNVREMGDVRVFMSRGPSRPMQERRILEVAYQAVAAGKQIVQLDKQQGGISIDRVLEEKFADPIAGILGALMLIADAERTTDLNERARLLEPLDVVVPNLRRLVGNNHPDVEAISQWCPKQKLRTKVVLDVPPMYTLSWKAAAHGAMGHRGVAGPIWNRIKAKIADPVFLTWAEDKRTRKAYERQLHKTIRTTLKSATRAGVGTSAPGSPKRRAGAQREAIRAVHALQASPLDIQRILRKEGRSRT